MVLDIASVALPTNLGYISWKLWTPNLRHLLASFKGFPNMYYIPHPTSRLKGSADVQNSLRLGGTALSPPTSPSFLDMYVYEHVYLHVPKLLQLAKKCMDTASVALTVNGQ